jgi:hypothetical protein
MQNIGLQTNARKSFYSSNYYRYYLLHGFDRLYIPKSYNYKFFLSKYRSSQSLNKLPFRLID